MRQGRDSKGHADLRIGERVLDRRQQVDHRALELLQERRRDALGSGRDVNRRRLERDARRGLCHPRIDIEERRPGAVNGQLQLFSGRGSAKQNTARVAMQIHAEDVIAVGWKRVQDRESPARPEWGALGTTQLRGGLGDLVVSLARRGLRVAERQHRDLAGGAQVTRQQRRRERL